MTAAKAQRREEDIHLIAVSKKQPVEKIRAAVEAGANIFGENYPEEAAGKIPDLPADLEWHMIGHLQSRKSPLVTDYFNCIHSIDSLHTARKLNEALCIREKKMTCFLEVNLAGEESKHGFLVTNTHEEDLFLTQAEEIRALKNLKPVGLMVMPPFAEDAEKSRALFNRARILLVKWSQLFSDPDFCELSMGTSQDYRVAIEEGATYIRIGTAIFGKR